MSVGIPHIQNLGLLRDKTCGWISLLNPLNDRKTAAKRWKFLILISSPVHRAPEPEAKCSPQGSAAFPKPQGIHGSHSTSICSQTPFFKSPGAKYTLPSWPVPPLTVTVGKSINTIETIISFKYIPILQFQD